MAKSREINMNLPSVDDLFTTQEERDDIQSESIRELPLEEISMFPNHPFKIVKDEKMLELKDSIEEYGVLMPVLVRPRPNGGYEMVSGHRRKYASELAGKQVIPCIIRNMTDDEATIIMVDSVRP